MKRASLITATLLLVLASAGTGQQLETRRVSIPDDLYPTSISFDGRYLTISYYRGGVALFELQTGKLLEVTPPVDPASTAFADWAHASRDGTRVAYTMFDGAGWDFRVVEPPQNPRVLATNLGYPFPMGWSPDGDSILIRTDRDHDGSSSLALVSASDGTIRTLKEFDPPVWGIARLSPDGRYVSYDTPAGRRTDERDIWVLPVGGGRETRVVESPSNDLLLGWVPDGSALLFQSDRGGSPGWWLQPITNGRAAGPAVLSKADMWGDPVALGFTQDGSLYYRVSVGRREVFVAGLDADGIELNGTQRRVSGSHRLKNGAIAWSPDGDQLAFVATEGRPAWGSGSDLLVIWSRATGQLRELRPDLTLIGVRIQWDPDGRSILVSATQPDGAVGLFRIDVLTGEATKVGPWIRGMSLSPDGKTAYHHRREGGAADGVVALDLETGRMRDLFVRPNWSPDLQMDKRYLFGSLKLSPDGTQLLLRAYDADAVLVMPAEGGEPRVLLSLGVGGAVVGTRWAPDGGSVWVTTRLSSEDERLHLWRVSLDDGSRELITRCEPEVPAPCFGQIHPDGNRIAYGVGQGKLETWVARGFPAARGGNSPRR